jgi:Trypsin-like peptidase domain
MISLLKRSQRFPALLTLLVLLALLALPAGAAGAATGHPLPTASASFWTPARVQKALSVDSLEHRRLADPAGAGNSFKVTEPSAEANRTNGKILGLDPHFGPYSCSGTSLATPSGSIVLTAGHCVYDEGRFGTHLVFVPAYNHKERPFGTFLAERVFVPTPWRRTENSDFDVAAMQVAPTDLGTLTTVVGAKGWTSSRSRFTELQIFGYPGGGAKAEEMRECMTRGAGSDRSLGFLFGPPPLAANCNTASGSSGGAWLAEGGTLIDGVTSYHYPPDHIRHYSPYFGPQIDRFLHQLP